MIAREHDSGNANVTVAVDLSIDDIELADRVRRMLMEDPGIRIVAGDGLLADMRVTDRAIEIGDGAPLLVIGAGADALDALRAGASAVLSEDIDAGTLSSAIRGVAHGLTVFTQDVRDQLFRLSDLDGPGDAEDEFLAAELTERELQVLALLAEGASNKSIARALAITPHTAKFHVASIVAKLGATGRTEAVAKAMRMGLLMI